MSDMDPCYLYMIATIQDEVACAPIKVGITKSPGSRLSMIRTGCPNKVDIACVLWANRSAIQRMEKMFHEEYAEYALAGEWFDVSPLAAGESLIKIYRGFLNGATKLTEDHVWHAVNESGLYALEKHCEGQRYIQAWESA